MSRIRRFLIVVSCLVILTGVLFHWNRARSVALLVPRATGFVEVTRDVWVERGMTDEMRNALVREVTDARRLLRQFYVAPLGRPVVLACASARCFHLRGGVGRATTFFGNRVLVSPAAINSVKLAHEFSHVELATRIGALRALLRVPQWFDEGLAVLVSDDPAFDEAKWLAATAEGTKVPPLGRLETLREFLAMTRGADGQLSYGTARHEVARWYARVGLPGVDRLFTMMRDGYDFGEAYSAAWNGIASTGQRVGPPVIAR